MASSPEAGPTEVRVLAIGGLFLEAAVLAWETRAEWEIAIPALLLIHLVGLLGLGLYRLTVRSRSAFRAGSSTDLRVLSSTTRNTSQMGRPRASATGQPVSCSASSRPL